MANVRCKKEHSEDLIIDPKTRVNYVARVEPLKYLDTAVICGREGCIEPGLAHLSEDEWQDYREGERYFYPFRTNMVKIEVGDNAETIERHNDGTISFHKFMAERMRNK